MSSSITILLASQLLEHSSSIIETEETASGEGVDSVGKKSAQP